VPGQVAVTKAALPFIQAAGGRIVFIGSIGGKVATMLMGPYIASKFATARPTGRVSRHRARSTAPRSWSLRSATMRPCGRSSSTQVSRGARTHRRRRDDHHLGRHEHRLADDLQTARPRRRGAGFRRLAYLGRAGRGRERRGAVTDCRPGRAARGAHPRLRHAVRQTGRARRGPGRGAGRQAAVQCPAAERDRRARRGGRDGPGRGPGR